MISVGVVPGPGDPHDPWRFHERDSGKEVERCAGIVACPLAGEVLPYASGPSRPSSTHFRGYGLGWSLSDYQRRMVASHGGGCDGMFSRVVLVPEAKSDPPLLSIAPSGDQRSAIIAGAW